MANVEVQWDFDKDIKKYRFETFCYGPKSCKFYKMGRARSVPYKNRSSAIDDGYLDELCTKDRDEEDLLKVRDKKREERRGFMEGSVLKSM